MIRERKIYYYKFELNRFGILISPPARLFPCSRSNSSHDIHRTLNRTAIPLEMPKWTDSQSVGQTNDQRGESGQERNNFIIHNNSPCRSSDDCFIPRNRSLLMQIMRSVTEIHLMSQFINVMRQSL